MKEKISIIEAVTKMDRLVFRSCDVSAVAGVSLSSATQSLNRLQEKGFVTKIFRGVWGKCSDKRFSQFDIIPYLFGNHRSYISFTSALHIYGVVGQIPQVITVASTAHSKRIKTTQGTFEVHQLSSDFFDGFDWHGNHDYLIATPEKAFVDCLYLASRKGRQFANFPELEITLLKKVLVFDWIEKIANKRIRASVLKRANELF